MKNSQGHFSLVAKIVRFNGSGNLINVLEFVFETALEIKIYLAARKMVNSPRLHLSLQLSAQSFYREDPMAIAFIFGLQSLDEIESAFKGKLYETLTESFFR